MKIEKTANKNTVQLIADLGNTKLEHIIINGRDVGIMGFTSEKDKANAEQFLQDIVDNSDNIYEIMAKMSQMATLCENNVTPDEEINIGGSKYYISYKDRTVYDTKANVVADLEDLASVELPDVAIKTLLTDRVKLAKQ